MTTSGNCDKPVTLGGTPEPWKPSLPPTVLEIIRFYSNMANIGINFSDEEREVIAEYNLYEKIKSYVDQYGSKPDGSKSFILSDADQQKYPRFTELVRGLPDFVEQHDRVKQALIRHTNLPWSKIKVLLKLGSGPKLIIKDLRPELGDKAYGRTQYPSYPISGIEDQSTFVQGLEQANYLGTREATAFLLTVTLLHEITYYGAVDGGRTEVVLSDEFGNDFEREILGTKINKRLLAELCQA